MQRSRAAYFNPRAPCGARPLWALRRGAVELFQPTRPLRGATGAEAGLPKPTVISTHAPLAGRDILIPFCYLAQRHFNPRAPCGARPRPPRCAPRRSHFNPRAPCGARPTYHIHAHSTQTFQPTRPLRGATKRVFGVHRDAIHFNPRAPCGARHKHYSNHAVSDTFQPTRPLRGATCGAVGRLKLRVISTHAPLAGRDRR